MASSAVILLHVKPFELSGEAVRGCKMRAAYDESAQSRLTFVHVALVEHVLSLDQLVTKRNSGVYHVAAGRLRGGRGVATLKIFAGDGAWLR